MRVWAGVIVALALAQSAAPVAPAAGAAAAAVSHTVVVVTTTADVVNGDVSSVAALNARPGRDGISLREALEATDATKGTATLYIMFSRALNGKTIELRSELPPLRRSHLVLAGVAPNGAPAVVTIDGRHAGSIYTLLLIQASEVTVRWLRFTGVKPTGHGWEAAMIVRPGTENNPGTSAGPKTVAGVQIEDNVFDNRGITFPAYGGPSANGLIISPYPQNPANKDTVISDVTVAGNTFLNYTGNADGLGVWANGSRAAISGVVIEDNRFAGDQFSIELSAGGAAPRQQGTQVVGNTISGGQIGISVNTTNATGATIAGTLIADDYISGIPGSAVNIGAEEYVPGLPGAAYGDTISGTELVNNVVDAGNGSDVGIYLDGGDHRAAQPSRIAGLTIENDTLVNNGTGDLLTLIPNGVGASGNQITGVNVRNTILYDPNGTPINGGGPVPEQPPDVVMNSLVSGPGWAGKNGNLTGDPEFADEAAGDYKLTAGSPCIDAGTTIGAPRYDFDGAARGAPPDVGAFEYGAAARPMLTVTVELLGGNGTVDSSPAGIRCGTQCSARFNSRTRVTLGAQPSAGSRFLGWAGACAGTRSCTLVLTAGRSVTARFGP